jgi:hypothetical protein
LVRPDSPDDLARGLLAAADLRGRVHSAPVTWQAVAQSYADVFAAVVPPAEPPPVTTRLKPGRWSVDANSYLSTAAKWDISTLDALRGLFNGHAWLPFSLQPTG